MARKRKGAGSGQTVEPAPTWLDSLRDPIKRAAAFQEAHRRLSEQFMAAIREADALFEKEPRRAAIMAMMASERFVSMAQIQESPFLNIPEAGKVFRALTTALHDLDQGIVHAALAPAGRAGDALTRVGVFEMRMRIWASVAVEFRRRRLRGRGPLTQACKEIAQELPIPRHKGYVAGEPWKVIQQWHKEVREGRGRMGAACKTMYESHIEGLDPKNYPSNDLAFDELALIFESMALTRAKEAARDWQVASGAEATFGDDTTEGFLRRIAATMARRGGE